MLTRRGVLAGLAAAGLLAGQARAKAPLARPAGGAGIGVGMGTGAEPLEAIFARSRLAGNCGFCLVDLADGRVIEAHRADVAFPPASVTKIVTTLYALATLGPDYRFATRVLASAPPAAGKLAGDLVLAGTGDPVLDTDALGDLAAEVGPLAVSGGLKIATGALPEVAFIDPDQPDGAGYNPAVGGINLNFNRVFLQWSPGKAGPQLAFRAPGERFSAEVPLVSAELADGLPAPRRAEAAAGELWLLPRGGLGSRGSLWLPIRAPGPYAGQVFRELAAGSGIDLPAAELVGAAPEAGALLAERQSAPCAELLRGMLFHSTNLTAEVMGLRATQLRGGDPGGLAVSAGAMTDWARARFGIDSAAFVNHSGLSDRTRLTPADQIRVLRHDPELLAGLLRSRAIADGEGGTFRADGVQLVCKTGTLDFVSALAGYLEGPGDRRLAFAIFAADPAARAGITPDQRADPPGARAWAGRARGQQAALLRRWVQLHAA